ncbi:MAG: protein-disulfide reductase DsbD family protein [Paracoccus sp. (in: a-proteobacteria)]|nr:protein-disulfide reductase DsbD family protein [Paracoccus sp. (in: a-proteobacteria)]
MRYAPILAALTMLSALPASALPAVADLPPGLVSARLLPGWVAEGGDRVSALELVLQPGWKTYWRSPGDSGLPPEFDWRGSNIGAVRFHWPAPEVIVSDGERTLGYHERLILPFTVAPSDPSLPVGISAGVSFGLCENICIPASLDLIAPAAAASPDPVIEDAMALAPRLSEALPACEISEIEDGMSLTLIAPETGADIAVEYEGGRDIWVSSPEIDSGRGELRVDLVAPSGRPFPVDPGAVVITLIEASGATEFRGCATAG